MSDTVLHVVTGIGGGVGQLISQWYYNVDRNLITQCVATWMKGATGARLEQDGLQIVELPRIRKTGFIGYTYRIYKLIKQYNCKIVHSHVGVISPCVFVAAMLAGVKVRVLHAHAVKFDYDRDGILWQAFLHTLFFICVRMATDYFACSREAGVYFFGDRVVRKSNFHVMNNGINVKNYIYNPELREELRASYSVERKYVIVSVGRLSRIKNHDLMLRIEAYLVEKNANTVLWSIGAGEDEEEIKRKCSMLEINEHVTFWGWRTDIHLLLQAADVFLMPSIAEGLGISLIEAQAADLPCVISDTIPSVACITPSVIRISLQASVEEWAHALLDCRNHNRKDTSDQLITHGFDMYDASKELERVYVELSSKGNKKHAS